MKIFAAVLLALIFTFLFLVGLKINYLDRYGVEIYFNAFFSSNQPYGFLFFFLFCLAAMYLPKKGAGAGVLCTFAVALSTFFAGDTIGIKLYSQKAAYTIGEYTTPDLQLLYSYRGVDYVLFAEDKSVKTLSSDLRTR